MISLRLDEFKKKLDSGVYSYKRLVDLKKQCSKDGGDYNTKRLILIENQLCITQQPPKKANSTTIKLNEVDILSASDLDLIVADKLKQMKASADKRNKEFNLTFTDVKRLLKRKTCYYTGLKFNPDDTNLGLTIDRIDNKLGYVKGNVVSCCNAVNSLKEHILERDGTFFQNNPKLLFKMISKLI